MGRGWEIDGFLESRDGRLHISGADAVALAEEFGTPLFVYSGPRVLSNIDRVRAIEKVVRCPVKVCYAAKAMSTMALLSVVKRSGIDIEVNSGGELWKALEIGFTGEQIIFNGTSKEMWEIENAIAADIYAIQVDSLYELSLIEQTAQRLGRRARVSLRLVPDIETATHSGLKTALLTSKFGMMPDEAFAAFRDFADSPHVELNGVHLHIGSQNPYTTPYSEAFTMLFDCLVRIHNETGRALQHINLGGGFPVNYLRDDTLRGTFPDEQRNMFAAGYEPADAIEHAWAIVEQAADSAGAGDLLQQMTLLLEPGRSIVSDAGICLTTVRNAKSRPVPAEDAEEWIDNWLLTDAGFNNLLSMETYKWYYHLISASRSTDPHVALYKVAGPLCDGGDVYFDIEGQGRLPDRRPLPVDVRPGEILALLNCGAYSLTQESQYNGRFRPAIVMIGPSGEAALIREREDFSDLVASDIY